MKNKKLIVIPTAIYLSVVVITFIVDLIWFEKIELSSFLLATFAGIGYFVFLRKLEPMYYLSILGFTFLAEYIGAMLSMYRIFSPYDAILHFSSGVLLVFLCDYLLSVLIKRAQASDVPLSVRIWFCFLGTAASAALWEIWEFSGDVIFKLNSQLGSLNDTMGDIIAGTLGGLLGIIILSIILKKKKQRN